MTDIVLKFYKKTIKSYELIDQERLGWLLYLRLMFSKGVWEGSYNFDW